MVGVIQGRQALDTAEVEVIAGAAVTVDLDPLRREKEALSGLREDQGASETAEALSVTGVHHRHLKGGSVALHRMRGAHDREVAHP